MAPKINRSTSDDTGSDNEVTISPSETSNLTPFMGKGFLEQLTQEKLEMRVVRGNMLTSERTEKILAMIQDRLEFVSIQEALTVVSMLFQQGDTSRGCDGNVTVEIFKKQFKLSSLRRVLRDAGYDRSERKLARTLASEIDEICRVLELSGNLSQKIQRFDSARKFSKAELAWLSDFQATNENAPSGLR